MNTMLAIGLFFLVSIGIFLFFVFRGGTAGDTQPSEPPPPVVESTPTKPVSVEESLDTLEDYCGITEADRRARIANRLSRIGGTLPTSTDELNNTVDTLTPNPKKATKS